VNRGDTFFADHLNIVCTEPTANGSVVVVNATSAKWDSDRNCEVGPKDHPSLRHDSVIVYERSRIYTRDQQQALEQNALYAKMRRASASADLIRKIQDGALVSDQTPTEVEEIIQAEVNARS
jgi:hypothetical protein